jgi:hypothetical protein
VPFISSDIEKGSRWSADIAEHLEACTFGIACVTRDNISAPWLLFEAGALSKSVSQGRLIPLLCGLEQKDVQKSPLTQFQMAKFEKNDFFKLLLSINEAIGDDKLDEKVLSGVFNALWPDLEKYISPIIDGAPVDDDISDIGEVSKIDGAIEELLVNSRNVLQSISRPDRLFPEEYILGLMGRIRRSDDDEIIIQSIDQIKNVVARSLMIARRLDDSEDAGRKIAMLKSLLHEADYLLRGGLKTRREMATSVEDSTSAASSATSAALGARLRFARHRAHTASKSSDDGEA